ncbi:hypothetical protein [Streptomyces sp. NPDC057694]|uniref:hypothetical protein n=1 Tax=Streptomyces sp. NPDC057694 TaxID=3346216 RepID=UPI0036CAE5C2
MWLRWRRALNRATVLTAVAGAAGACLLWSAPGAEAASAKPVPVTAYTQRSEAGDWIGQGEAHTYRAPAADIRVLGDDTYATAIIEAGDVRWSVEMQAPAGDRLTPGVFRGAERAPGPSGRAPGLSVGGDGRGCNTVYGQFTINQIDTDGKGEIALLDASYVQRCEEADAPALRGTIKYKALPLSFSYVSEPGDYAGGGRSRTFTNGIATFTLDGTVDGRIEFGASGLRETWNALVVPPTGQSFQVGRTYQADELGDDEHGMLSVGGGGCNHSNGEFTVDKLVADASGQITALALTFEQHCEGADPALRGTIHYFA